MCRDSIMVVRWNVGVKYHLDNISPLARVRFPVLAHVFCIFFFFWASTLLRRFWGELDVVPR